MHRFVAALVAVFFVLVSATTAHAEDTGSAEPTGEPTPIYVEDSKPLEESSELSGDAPADAESEGTLSDETVEKDSTGEDLGQVEGSEEEPAFHTMSGEAGSGEVFMTTMASEETAGLPLRVGEVIVDDSETGDGNGLPSPGERVRLKIELWNEGDAAVTGALATLTTSEAEVVSGSSTYPTIDPGASAFNDTLFELVVNADAAASDVSCPAFIDWFGSRSTPAEDEFVGGGEEGTVIDGGEGTLDEGAGDGDGTLQDPEVVEGEPLEEPQVTSVATLAGMTLSVTAEQGSFDAVHEQSGVVCSDVVALASSTGGAESLDDGGAAGLTDVNAKAAGDAEEAVLAATGALRTDIVLAALLFLMLGLALRRADRFSTRALRASLLHAQAVARALFVPVSPVTLAIVAGAPTVAFQARGWRARH